MKEKFKEVVKKFFMNGRKALFILFILEIILTMFITPNTYDDEWFIDMDEIIQITKSDKKMEQGNLRFILLKKIGKAVIDRNVSEDELRAGIEEIIYRDEFE